MQNQIKRFTSRTAALTAQTCLRKRYLSNHYGGHGLSPEAIDMNLETGTAVHRGIQHLFEHCRLEHPDGMFEEQCINQAIDFAIKLFRDDISKHSIALKEGETNFITFVIAEHECLIEGLIRCFALKRLPSLLEEYEIIEVENDIVYHEFSESILWQNKADAEFLTKDYSKGVIICSLKTASEYAENTIRNLLTDMQGNSEWMAVQAKLDRDFANYTSGKIGLTDRRWDNYFEWCITNEQKPKVYAVQYEHLITGSWKDYDKSGLRKRQNFLVHPYKYEEQTTLNVFSQVVTQFTATPDHYKWKANPGRQPKGWSKINIWEDMGIKNWVEMLASGLVQTENGNPLDELIITSDLIFRDRNDGAQLYEWLESTRYQEEEIFRKLDILEQFAADARKRNDWRLFEKTLMHLFPKETQRCWDYFGHDCQFTKVCHEGFNLGDLIAGNVYVNRTPHHVPEKLYHIERGFIKE